MSVKRRLRELPELPPLVQIGERKFVNCPLCSLYIAGWHTCEGRVVEEGVVVADTAGCPVHDPGERGKPLPA